MPLARCRWIGLAPLAAMSSLALATMAGSAQVGKEWNCTGTSDVAWDVQISGCTTAIRSGNFAGKDLARALFARGEAYQATGNYDRAVADYNEAVRLDAGFALAYARRGVAFARKGEPDAAIADFTAAIGLDPNLRQAYNNRSIVYHRKGEYDRAIADLTEAIRLDPKRAESYYRRGSVYGSKGDADRAIADFTEAIRLDPKSATAYHDRGFFHARKGDLDRAIADFTEAIDINPNYAKAYFGRGLAKGRKADRSGSEADIARARELDPNVAPAQSTAATPLGDQVEQRLQQLRDAQKSRNVPQSNTLTASDMQALTKRLAECWNVPEGLRKAADLVVTVHVKLTKDGSLAEPPKVLNSNPDPRFAVAAKSAIAGLTRCAPFSFLPAAKYAAWREMIVDFNPRELFGDRTP